MAEEKKERKKREPQPEVTEDNYEELLDSVEAETSTKGERFYARKFKSAYNRLRKATVVLNKVRTKITNEEAVKKLFGVVNEVYDELSEISDLEDKDEE